ncbi:hypothetical protein GCM10010358_31850 [Streptomyces minutiscleroticus]|uniref:Uncharacterized protein n=1 Tax=Streptomyces minutiscleroticus TaxID=68238 RepID=A0A918KUW8_9ACTN|nr:hypothetical protein GCM10010358_31850 [Streptomyces minutiscleroticus]
MPVPSTAPRLPYAGAGTADVVPVVPTVAPRPVTEPGRLAGYGRWVGVRPHRNG